MSLFCSVFRMRVSACEKENKFVCVCACLSVCLSMEMYACKHTKMICDLCACACVPLCVRVCAKRHVTHTHTRFQLQKCIHSQSLYNARFCVCLHSDHTNTQWIFSCVWYLLLYFITSFFSRSNRFAIYTFVSRLYCDIGIYKPHPTYFP